MEAFVLVDTKAVRLPGDTSHHLGDHDKVDDQRRGQKGIFTHVEQANGLMATHEDFSIILVKCALVVSDSRHVFDDYTVIRVLSGFVQDRVGCHHVIHNGRFRYLLGPELLVGAQVHAIVVAEMIVAGYSGDFQSRIDHEVYERGLHLGLARLEVVASDEGIVLLSQLNCSRDECVLRRAINEGGVFQDGGNREHRGWGNLFVSGFYGLHQILGGVIYTRYYVGVAFRVGSPLDDNLVETMLLLEFTSSSQRRG